MLVCEIKNVLISQDLFEAKKQNYRIKLYFDINSQKLALVADSDRRKEKKRKRKGRRDNFLILTFRAY